ncbi:MAG: hypothetical protein HVN35_03195 [Methanobacteriaceae archaeon]|nr:hypothetical protein [Methanobacteriaceae archaeon]
MPILTIVVEGTRGKSSVVRFFHKFFYENGYNTLSRETGLVPMIYYNDQKIFVKRSGELPFNLLTEVKLINELYPEECVDVAVFENNAIRTEYMRSLSDYLRADVVIITTITFDHILSQGFTMEETAETFIKSIPPYSHMIFWSNHQYEYELFKKTCENMGISDCDILHSKLEDRELVIYQALEKILKEKNLQIPRDISEFTTQYVYECPIDEKCPVEVKSLPDEIFSSDLSPRTFVDIGHINDPIHTHIIFHQILAEREIENHEIYLLFNFREDRLERIPLFIEGFLPLVQDHISGIIIHSTNVAFTPDYLIGYIKKNLKTDKKIKFHKFNDFKEFIGDVVPQLPPNSYIVMVANTADKFGYELIDRLNLFRDSYPILNHINLFELRYSKKPEELY